MYTRYENPAGKPKQVIMIGIGVTALFWIIDTASDTFVFRQGTFLEELLTPPHHRLWERLLFVCVLTAFIAYASLIIKGRDRLASALHDATLKAEEERARTEAIIAALGDGLSIQDTEFKVIYQNRMHKELVGGDFAGQYCYRAYNGQDQVCPGCPIAASFQDGFIHKVEKVISLSPEAIQVEITASPLRDQSGRIVAGIEIVRDISQSKQAEEALDRQARFLQQLIDTIPSPVYYKDATYRFLGCNAAFEQCIGLPKERMLGKTFHDFLPMDQADAYFRKDAELFAHPGIQVYEDTIQCATGCRRDVIFNKATFTRSDGGLAGMVGVVIDITERKHAEEKIRSLNEKLAFRATQLTAANRELEAFSSSVSHDLRSHITCISSAGQLLKEIYSGSLDEVGRNLVLTICTVCEEMDGLITALLSLARITRGKIDRAECSLSDSAAQIVAELRIGEPQRRVDFAIEPGITDYGDPRMIRVLLENLIANAWKYTRKKADARIEFGATESGGERIYFVRDNGAGFDMSKADQLFKPFQRLHDSSEFRGTGIGLATVQRIVVRHSGRVWGEGEVGRGATFYFTLK